MNEKLRYEMKKNIITKLLLGLIMMSLFTVPSLFADTSYYDEEIPYGPYYIQSAQEFMKSWKGCWDVPGNPNHFKNGQNINVWDVTQQDSKRGDRLFHIRNLSGNSYEINSMLNPSHKNRVDVAGGKSANGTNIQLWTGNGSSAQKYRLKHIGKGRWKIYTTKGKILCLKGRSSKNGSNVHIWNDHNGPWCEWVFINAKTRTVFIPARKITVSLEEACKEMDGNRGRRYFGKVSAKKIRRDNTAKSIHETVTAMGEDMVAALQNIVIAARENKNSKVRAFVYKELSLVDTSKAKTSFALRLQLSMIKETIQTTAKHEKDNVAKSHLNTLLNNM